MRLDGYSSRRQPEVVGSLGIQLGWFKVNSVEFNGIPIAQELEVW